MMMPTDGMTPYTGWCQKIGSIKLMTFIFYYLLSPSIYLPTSLSPSIFTPSLIHFSTPPTFLETQILGNLEIERAECTVKQRQIVRDLSVPSSIFPVATHNMLGSVVRTENDLGGHSVCEIPSKWDRRETPLAVVG